jgi:hypothetical protein
MASNRSRAHQRSTALAAPADALPQALRALGRRAAHIQIACCGAVAITFTSEEVALPCAAANRTDMRVARAWTNH